MKSFKLFLAIAINFLLSHSAFAEDGVAAISLVFNNSGVVRQVSSSYMENKLGSYYDHSTIIEPATKRQSYTYEEMQEIGRKLSKALEEHRAVDLFVVSHTNMAYQVLDHVKPAFLRKKIRLVYNTGCYDAGDADEWLKRDVSTYVGHPGLSCSPLFMESFINEWRRGGTVENAVFNGNYALAKNILGVDVGPAQEWPLSSKRRFLEEWEEYSKQDQFKSGMHGTAAGEVCAKVAANYDHGKAYRQSAAVIAGRKKSTIASLRPKGFLDEDYARYNAQLLQNAVEEGRGWAYFNQCHD